jgi:hypothetical protein
MSDRTKVFLTIAGFALAMPVAAQAPTSTGTAIEWPEGGLSCGKADDDRLSAKVPEGPRVQPRRQAIHRI